MTDRYEFYKARGETLAVTTCACCRDDGFQDMWMCHRGQVNPGGIKVGAKALRLHDGYTLITEREARKRAPKLLPEWD